jgi:hypothetical protein
VPIDMLVDVVVNEGAKRGSPRPESLVERQPQAGEFSTGAGLPLAYIQVMVESVSLHFR